jgi:hypothetical protein
VTKQRALEMAIKDIESIKQAIEVLETLPDLDAHHVISPKSYYEDSDIVIRMPFDLETYRSYRRKLAAGGWKITRAFLPNSGNRQSIFDHPDFNVRVVIVLDASVSGSTCFREMVGEQTETVYRIRCE